MKNVKTTWKSIYINNNISNIAKSELIFKALNDGTLTQQLINELNIDKCITSTINEITEFGNRYKNQFITIQELNAIIDIKIDNLNNFNKNEINEFLLKNNCYKINFNNSYKNDDNIFIIIVLRKVIIIDKIGLSFTKSIIL